VPAPSSLRALTTSRRVAARAGARPNKTPVAIETKIANASTRRSRARSSTTGTGSGGRKVERRSAVQAAPRAPAAPPRRLRRTLSVSSWRIRAALPRSQGRPDPDLAPPHGRAREQEVGEVRAGDQQDQAHHRHQEGHEAEDGPADFGKDAAGGFRYHGDAAATLLHIRPVLWVGLMQLDGQSVETSLHARDVRSWSEAPGEEDAAIAAVGQPRASRARHVLHGERDPQVHGQAPHGAHVFGRGHPDDLERRPVEGDGTADDAGVGSERAPPEPVRDHGDGVRARVLFRHEPRPSAGRTPRTSK
jgi:hypothetical protein